jgi:hypothetical protein
MSHKANLLFGLLLSVCSCFAQNVPRPETFLGYPQGAHFTPHYKIVEYFKAVAAAAPDRMKLVQYGTTNEGRPLMLAIASWQENLKRLEEIRLNNLRLAGVLRDGKAADEHAPVIVWLSYNVHGNEPASSEAAMKMLWWMTSTQSQGMVLLKDIVVIVDPCINPDGRDRYVSWYNSVVGNVPNADPQSREHQEPWPHGRTNHYNFDLNRDWAWQTQKETQARMMQYQAWLPQIHVDYHEQGYNNPYYFAPAAEPYHDVITPWQREFQVLVGKRNASIFDQEGWLYFTKQEFDLFYPSYGDTYPIYNGAIGMTFEQGGIGAGLAVLKSDGDTLTLAQRIEHHYITGVIAAEMAYIYKDRLVHEFHNYFIEAATHPSGEYKAYFLRNDSFGDRLERLRTLLDRNGISWELVNNGTALTGVDYETGRTASFRSAPGDIVINANQPKSNLVRVLFERKSHISDSVTYDITAWSVPFVYGVQAYGLGGYVTEAKPPAPGHSDTVKPSIPDSTFALAVHWTGMESVRFLTALLQNGVKVRYAERPFQSGGVSFDRGTLLLLAPGMRDTTGWFWRTAVADAAFHTGVTLVPIASGFVEKGPDFGSDLVHVIHKPRVAVLTGEQVNSQEAGEVWHLFEQEIGYPVTLINAASIGRVAWKNFDVLILPNGFYRSLEDKNNADLLINWVREGGRLIAMQDAVAQLSKLEWGIRQKSDGDDKKDDDKEQRPATYADLHRYDNRQREEVANSVPGSIYRVELDNSHPLAFGYPDHYYTLKQDENVYEFIKDGGWNVGVVRKDGYVSGFTGNKAREKIKDGVIFGVQDQGKGTIVYMADDPLFRSFWENGKLLFCNGVFLVGQ